MNDSSSPPPQDPQAHQRELDRERWELVAHLSEVTSKPLIALSIVWLGLLIIDLTMGLSRPLVVLHYIIWGLFILDFAMGMLISPHRTVYLRRNWLGAISLALPILRVLLVLRAFTAFRALRVLRLARAARPVGLMRVITSLNRSMRAMAATFGKRGLGYAAAITILVIFGGAAGMAFFESPESLRRSGYVQPGEVEAGLTSYGEAVWFTSMIMTTVGTGYWPVTWEGRVLCWLLSVYALAIFGYITANIAVFFIEPKPSRSQQSRAP